MLVVDRGTGSFRDEVFANLPRFIQTGDCLLLNSSRVFPARLHGKKVGTGAEVELFLTRAMSGDETQWRALARPAKRLHTRDRIVFGPQLRAIVVAEGEYGERVLQFESERPVADVLEEIGSIPLPPYIHREPDAADRERYQTVFARERGSVAAPTAGLHFTSEMLDRCREAGAAIADVVLHVGLGTFAPLRSETLESVQLHEERFSIGAEAAQTVRSSKRCICVGTTSVRALETALLRDSELRAAEGETNLFIYPGFRFRGTGALLTNFHLPQSSLLMLVCAFAGKELALAAYRHAVEQRYRFFSYGDCMLIV